MGAIRWARETRVPFLGICLGMQAAVIEYARCVEWGGHVLCMRVGYCGVHVCVRVRYGVP